MNSSAQREVRDDGSMAEAPLAEFRLEATGTELKRQVSERLAAHRQRRGMAACDAVETEGRSISGRRSRQSAVAATVAERYAQTPSYRAFLAEQAQRAMEEAAAAAEVARRNAEAVAAVQQELLVELELWDAPQEFTRETAESVSGVARAGDLAAEVTARRRDVADPKVVAGLTVRLYEDLGMPAGEVVRGGRSQAEPDAAESRALDAEIDFRKSPVFEDYKAFLAVDREPPVPLPANLLEFPRQLVAARRARPRLAEGPLLDEAPRNKQLRIFEVEAEQISTAPVMAATASEWASSIRLDAHSVTAPVASDDTPLLASLLPPQTAPLALRTMATLVDVGLVLGGLVAFVAVFAEVAGQVLVGLYAGAALAITGVALWLVYQLLFFSLSEQTPGMRYARIGLCTLADENPTRGAMRWRILAQMVAAGPVGLGLVWALVDDDGLGWHDRLSKMYQRAY